MKAWAAVLALSSVSSCSPDEERLRGLAPSAFQITSLESRDYHLFDCHRATYLVQSSPDLNSPTASISIDGEVNFDGWRPLTSMGSSSFTRCVDSDEQALWQIAIADGRAIETTAADLRVWFDPVDLRLTVLAYQP